MATWIVTYRETTDGPVQTREITATMKYEQKAPGTPFLAFANATGQGLHTLWSLELAKVESVELVEPSPVT